MAKDACDTDTEGQAPGKGQSFHLPSRFLPCSGSSLNPVFLVFFQGQCVIGMMTTSLATGDQLSLQPLSFLKAGMGLKFPTP
jgi:hypothetical protein